MKKSKLFLGLTAVGVFLTSTLAYGRELAIVKKGIINISSEEILLYRVLDITFKQSIWQKIFGVGSVILTTADKTTPVLELKNIKTPDRIRKALSNLVEQRRDEKRVTGKEMFGAAGLFHDHGDLEGVDLDGDGIPDVH